MRRAIHRVGLGRMLRSHGLGRRRRWLHPRRILRRGFDRLVGDRGRLDGLRFGRLHHNRLGHLRLEIIGLVRPDRLAGRVGLRTLPGQALTLQPLRLGSGRRLLAFTVDPVGVLLGCSRALGLGLLGLGLLGLRASPAFAFEPLRLDPPLLTLLSVGQLHLGPFSVGPLSPLLLSQQCGRTLGLRALRGFGPLQLGELRLQTFQLQPLDLGRVGSPTFRFALLEGRPLGGDPLRLQPLGLQAVLLHPFLAATSALQPLRLLLGGQPLGLHPRRLDPLQLAPGRCGLLGLGPLGRPPFFLGALGLPPRRLATRLVQPLLLQPVRFASLRRQPIGCVLLQRGLLVRSGPRRCSRGGACVRGVRVERLEDAPA